MARQEADFQSVMESVQDMESFKKVVETKMAKQQQHQLEVITTARLRIAAAAAPAGTTTTAGTALLLESAW